jgi:hypothetical protein
VMPPQCRLTHQPVFCSPIIPVCTLGSRIYASVISHLCSSKLTFALHSFRARSNISDEFRLIARSLNPSYAASTTSPAFAHNSANLVAV